MTIGPFIGTFCVAMTFHVSIFQRDPQHFLQGLITPSIVFPMIVALIFITPFGYLFGFIPAMITNLLFEHFFKGKMLSTSFLRVFGYACLLCLMWAPFIFILTMLIWNDINIFLYVIFIMIVPSTLICTLIEWRKLTDLPKNDILNKML